MKTCRCKSKYSFRECFDNKALVISLKCNSGQLSAKTQSTGDGSSMAWLTLYQVIRHYSALSHQKEHSTTIASCLLLSRIYKLNDFKSTQDDKLKLAAKKLTFSCSYAIVKSECEIYEDILKAHFTLGTIAPDALTVNIDSQAVH